MPNIADIVTEDCINPTFDANEIEKRLNKLNINKSTGVDNVHPRVLKECANSLAKPFSIIFNKSYLSGELPEMWSCANVTPLFKKGDKMDPSNYRPISLTSIICKLMKGIIRDIIMEHMVKKQFIN